MRILLVSDIHSNWAALQAIRESFDVCLFMGDLVDYGVEPTPCIDWARHHVDYGVRGNHDHGAAQCVMINGVSGFRYLSSVTRPITCEKLNEPDRRYLASLPLSKAITLNEKKFLLVHATPRDPMDEFAPPEIDFWLRRLEGYDVDYVICGHTHHPYILQAGRTTVINPGSVGLPRDGDPRAAYGIIDDNLIELKRIEYPIEKTIKAVQESGLPDKAIEMLAEIYVSGRIANGRTAERIGLNPLRA